jgi:hypothetical protein
MSDANNHGFDLVVLRGPRQFFLERGQHVGLRNEAIFILRANDPRQIEQQHFSVARAAELYFLHRPRWLDEIDRNATGLQTDDCEEAELNEHGMTSNRLRKYRFGTPELRSPARLGR